MVRARCPRFPADRDFARGNQPCAPNTRFTDHFFNFTDGDRHFDVLVAFGPSASSARQHDAWQILDSLRIDPNVRPDWQASP